MRRVGRKLKSEARTTELRKQLRAWKNLPKYQRQPRTLTAWAAEHDITRRMATYLLDPSPTRNGLEGDEVLQRAITHLVPKPKTVGVHDYRATTESPQTEPQQSNVPVVHWYWKKDWESDDEIWASNQLSYELKRQLLAERERREYAKRQAEWNAAK